MTENHKPNDTDHGGPATTFGAELAAARGKRLLSQTALAGLMTPGSSAAHQRNISRWENNKLTNPVPQNREVAELEQVLKLRPGTLARHLGYVWTSDKTAPSIEQAIWSAGDLTDEQKHLLIDMYTQLRQDD